MAVSFTGSESARNWASAAFPLGIRFMGGEDYQIRCTCGAELRENANRMQPAPDNATLTLPQLRELARGFNGVSSPRGARRLAGCGGGSSARRSRFCAATDAN